MTVLAKEIGERNLQHPGELAKAADYIVPSIYVTNLDPGEYLRANVHFIQEAQAWNKPIYSYVWPAFEGTTQAMDPAHRSVPAEYWKLVLDISRVYGDGAVIWNPGPKQWDASEAWWVIARRSLMPAVSRAAR